MEPLFPTLEGRFSTTGPLDISLMLILLIRKILYSPLIESKILSKINTWFLYQVNNLQINVKMKINKTLRKNMSTFNTEICLVVFSNKLQDHALKYDRVQPVADYINI